MGFLNIAIILRILLGFFQVFMQFLEIFFQRFFEIFDEMSHLVELYQKVFFLHRVQ